MVPKGSLHRHNPNVSGNNYTTRLDTNSGAPGAGRRPRSTWPATDEPEPLSLWLTAGNINGSPELGAVMAGIHVPVAGPPDHGSDPTV